MGGFQPMASGSALSYMDAELPGIPSFPAMDSQLSPNFFSSSPSDLSLDGSSLMFPSSSASVRSFSDAFDLDQAESSSSNSAPVSGLSPAATVDMAKKTRKRSWRPQKSPTSAYSGACDFSAAQRIMVRTNTGLMTENLMRLYHDVMEGALSCWLTEENCPYLPPLAKAARLPILADASSSHGFTSSQPASLPNRIYQRVVKLDKSLGSLGIKPLSSLEDKKATRALHLAIMAFTAQWAQGSQRSQERYHQRRMFAEDLLSSGFVEEFDATLQKSFWNQARRCLDDCAAIGSFKVALAELIFGLTQKHTDEPEWDADGLDQFMPGRGGGPGGGEGSLTASRVQRVLDEDGYSVYLERAARRLHVLKSRCESYERKEKEPGEEEDENAEGKATMKMVYWMAIMFDTLSAAITERPPTVSDEDSKESGGMQLAVAAGDGGYFSSISDDERWNDRYIIKRDPNLAPLRLPCSEEAISRELIDAAPVKVLLFRKITRIQNLSSRGASQSAVEDAIQEGLAVYRYWDATYRPMFQDCLQNHDTLPPKVQSWYVPLLGHWLLAVMIMADCVGLLDERGLSLPPRAEERAAAGALDNLRRTGMWAVSDLARASTPRDDEAGRLASYHPAVSEGALLTEPWTMVLIRSFVTAGRLFLDDAPGGAGAVAGEPGGPLAEHGGRLDLLDRCEDCVKALWYLGRKSSISRQVAGILGAGLDAERSKAFGLGGGVAACDPLASLGPVCGL